MYCAWSELTYYEQHNFSHHDCQAYYLRIADEWKPIDYSKDPDTWMTPLKQGQPTGLVEIPASWYLDDLPPMVSHTTQYGSATCLICEADVY